ncbi:unnamed protein product [Allacma fusca]|uniref:Uncharacterized protein n=1 Tax=Allacma fusca TaxID=39272 RepID=A0A8J2NW89_9HEXA|nr:unnamed protein product [Allacma fusca]
MFVEELLIKVLSYSEPLSPFGTEVPATEDQIKMIRILSDQIALKLQERRPQAPPVRYLGVSSFRLSTQPDGRRIFLIRIQLDSSPEYWGARVFQRDGYPLVLQTLFGPLRSIDPLDENQK